MVLKAWFDSVWKACGAMESDGRGEEGVFVGFSSGIGNQELVTKSLI